MKIEIAEYNPARVTNFQQIKDSLPFFFKGCNPKIGCPDRTSAPCLPVKPVIDVLVGMQHVEGLHKVVKLKVSNHHFRHRVYNLSISANRLSVKLKPEKQRVNLQKIHTANDNMVHEGINHHGLVHAHIRGFRAPDWNGGAKHSAGKDRFTKMAEVKTISWHRAQETPKGKCKRPDKWQKTR